MHNNKKNKTLFRKTILSFFVVFSSYFILTILNILITDFIPQKDGALEKNIFNYLSDKKELLKENKKLKEENEALKISSNNNISTVGISSTDSFKTYPVLLNNKDIYNSLFLKIKKEGDDNKQIFLGSLVLSKNNTAIGTIDKINLNNVSIKYFSKAQENSYLFLKNSFFEDHDDELEVNFKTKTTEEISEDNALQREMTPISEKEKLEKLRKNTDGKSFKIEVTGLGNGFIYFEVPREYHISEKSILYYSQNKLTPVAYFFEEKGLEQNPIKKVIFKMFENPENLIELKI